MSTAYDMLLDADGDIVITDDLVLVTDIVTAAAQQIRLAIGMFKGENFLDLDDGTPFYEDILGQKFNENKIRGVIRERIMTVDLVATLEPLTLAFNRGTRVLTIGWHATTITGESFSGSTEVGV